jgi:hypothetical protein
LAAALALAGAGCEKLPDLPNVPPVAFFIFTPVSPIYAGQTTVVFNASASRDPDGTVVSYIWNFGDGTPEVTATTPAVTHVFPVTARCVQIIYAVLLTVVDDKGARDSAAQNVGVIQLPAPGSAECAGR